MKLNLFERITLLSVLPKEGDFVTLRIVKDLKSALSVSEKEFKEFEITQEGPNTKWNAKGSEEREIKVGEKATDIIIEALKQLDKEKKLTEQHFTVYEKFVEVK